MTSQAESSVRRIMIRGSALCCALVGGMIVTAHAQVKAPAVKNATAATQIKPAPPSTALQTPAAEAKSQPSPLLPLGTGDIVNVQVYGRPELQTTNYISEDGTVAVPLIGNVPVAGLSATNAATRIAAAFKKGQYLKNPQVTVLVTQSRSQMVSVLGEVRAPGRFPVDASTNVLDLLAQAGGTTDRSGNTMYIIRTSDSGEVDRRPIDLRGLHSDRYALKLLTLRGGDSVYVPTADQFYIYGEVHEPNMYRLEPEMTVLQAISRGGGLTKIASSNRVEIKRRDENGQLVTRKVPLNERVQPDDVIYVKESLF